MSTIALSPEGLSLSPRLRQIEERAASLGLITYRYTDKSENAPALHVRSSKMSWWLIFSDRTPMSFLGAGTSTIEEFKVSCAEACEAYQLLTEGIP